MIHVVNHRGYGALIEYPVESYYGKSCNAIVTVCNADGDVEEEKPIQGENLEQVMDNARSLLEKFAALKGRHGNA